MYINHDMYQRAKIGVDQSTPVLVSNAYKSTPTLMVPDRTVIPFYAY